MERHDQKGSLIIVTLTVITNVLVVCNDHLVACTGGKVRRSEVRYNSKKATVENDD